MAVKEAEQAGDVLFYSVTDDEMDADYHIAVGESAAKLEPRIVYCALVTAAGKSVKIAVCCGKDARKIIGRNHCKSMSKILVQAVALIFASNVCSSKSAEAMVPNGSCMPYRLFRMLQREVTLHPSIHTKVPCGFPTYV